MRRGSGAAPQPAGRIGAAALADWSTCVKYKVLQPGTNVNKQRSRYGFLDNGGGIGLSLSFPTFPVRGENLTLFFNDPTPFSPAAAERLAPNVP